MLTLLLLSGLLTLSSCLSRQYYLVSNWTTWSGAQAYCRQHYTDLATIENYNDQIKITAAIADSGIISPGFSSEVWIGQYEDVQNSWRWYFDDDAFYGVGERNYRTWASNQPDNSGGKEMCIHMLTTGLWNDANCDLVAQFICYDGANSSYIKVNVGMNAYDARQYCRQYYTDLVSIRNATENQLIFNLAAGQIVWIGLYRTRLWSDQSNSTYENWNNGEPNNAGGNEHCTQMFSNGKWNDIPCDYLYRFVCYVVIPTTTATPVETNTSTVPVETNTSTVPATTNTAAVPVETNTSTVPATTNTAAVPVSPTSPTTPAMTNTTFLPVSVIGLRGNISSTRNLTEVEIKNLILKEFPLALSNGSLPSTIRIRVNRVKKKN